MPRSSVLVALAALTIFSLSACRTDGAPAPGGGSGPPPPPPPEHVKMCGGIGGIQCGPGQYCQMTPPLYPDKSGACRPKPQMCPMIYQPVCGMDAKTYPNACHAAREGVSVEHAGACAV